ncbi:hypothetical protein PF005_g2052 [Phytophthora fragariae]|uniref:Uncharacterized protein n=1 Tax=Phytophthora fragariae TaxID=53985 RepID=A0A6A3ZEV6_9STRA|nr:hypothetical protein PF003_g2435 [Phytophthora fragariae]KAE8948252.1 hypothetical protein PF009_g2169 [Phytophthora fragariae]KAE9136782.1 hypothetical protein PF007_g2068 [Phytophthora fragariae]KAE9154326.1 hypothetical protein PF006_g1643 [Phytophthora fragariae]KAE9234100.1 hypothetical protein PF005_g2052 [Phytophthora fragariae]
MAAGGSFLVLATLASKCRALGGACCGSSTERNSQSWAPWSPSLAWAPWPT